MMNPIVSIPVFLGLVNDYDSIERDSIAKKASIVSFIILAAFILLGKYIFILFGITIPAFKITGGIIVFYIGFEMLESRKSQIKQNGINTPEEADNIAISPLAVPILCGPGTIVTAMNYVANTTYIHLLIVLAVSLIVVYLNYLAFHSSKLILRKLGKNIITVLGKIMGLILAIIGTGMVISGVKMVMQSM